MGLGYFGAGSAVTSIGSQLSDLVVEYEEVEIVFIVKITCVVGEHTVCYGGALVRKLCVCVCVYLSQETEVIKEV